MVVFAAGRSACRMDVSAIESLSFSSISACFLRAAASSSCLLASFKTVSEAPVCLGNVDVEVEELSPVGKVDKEGTVCGDGKGDCMKDCKLMLQGWIHFSSVVALVPPSLS